MEQANPAMTNTTTTMVEIVTETVTINLIEDLNKTTTMGISSIQEDCLKNRKWWVFFLSSILTFVAGVLSVIVFRFINFIATNGIGCYTQDQITEV